MPTKIIKVKASKNRKAHTRKVVVNKTASREELSRYKADFGEGGDYKTMIADSRARKLPPKNKKKSVMPHFKTKIESDVYKKVKNFGATKKKK